MKSGVDCSRTELDFRGYRPGYQRLGYPVAKRLAAVLPGHCSALWCAVIAGAQISPYRAVAPEGRITVRAVAIGMTVQGVTGGDPFWRGGGGCVVDVLRLAILLRALQVFDHLGGVFALILEIVFWWGNRGNWGNLQKWRGLQRFPRVFAWGNRGNRRSL